jgi:hypothetical protein
MPSDLASTTELYGDDMHSGFLMAIRRFVVHAKPWQQVLTCASLVVAGIALITTGFFVGAIMIACGLLFGWQTLSAHRAAREIPTERDMEHSVTKPAGLG